MLEKLAAKIIWDVTVGHGADHYDYAAMDMHQIPFRLRTPPPDNKRIAPFKRSNMRTIVDTFKHRMCWKMFFSTNNVNLLCDTDYGFDGTTLQQYNKEFLADLQQTEKGLKEKGIINFIPLNQVSRTIQY